MQNIEVERQFVDVLQVLDQLPANRAPHTVIVVQQGQTLGAESVSAVNQNSRNLLSNVELVPTEVAKVESTKFVVSLDDWLRVFTRLVPQLLCFSPLMLQ